MHAPDGFLNVGTALATGTISAGAIGVALRQVKTAMADRLVPLAGVTAAFVFAAQMFNFPVAAGTTGHLLGGALAAVVLGPHLGAIVVVVVVIVQALMFADGGITALGYNILNMAVVPAYGGYALYFGLRKLLPATAGGVASAVGLAAAVSMVMSAAAFSIEWLFGATAPVSFNEVFAAMVGVHLLIGVGEGVISALTLGAILASRPDLVFGARDLDMAQLGRKESPTARVFVMSALTAALFIAAIVSQFASDDPDGLERVAESTGFSETAREHALADSLFADYATAGLDNETLSLAIAGVVGTLIVLTVTIGMAMALRGPPHRPRDA